MEKFLERFRKMLADLRSSIDETMEQRMNDEGYTRRVENRDGYIVILRNGGKPNKNRRVYPANMGGFSEDEAFTPYDPTSLTENFIFPHPASVKGSLVETLPGGPDDKTIFDDFSHLKPGLRHDGLYKDHLEILDMMIDRRVDLAPAGLNHGTLKLKIVKPRLPIVTKVLHPLMLEDGLPPITVNQQHEPVVLPIIKRLMPKLTADMILGVEMSEPPPPEQECLPSSFLNKKRMIDDAVDVTAQHKHNSPTLLTNEQLSRSA